MSDMIFIILVGIDIGISVSFLLDCIENKIRRNRKVKLLREMKEICDDIKNEYDSIIDVIEEMRKVIKENNN